MGQCNIVNIGTVVGKSSSGVLSSGQEFTLTHNVSSGNETWLVKSLILGNNASNGVDCQCEVSVSTDGGTTTRYISRYAWVPFGTSLVILDEALPIYLQYTDRISVRNAQGNNLNYILKYETLRE